MRFRDKNVHTPRLIADRGPLRVMFVLTSMPVGGAEILLRDLFRGMDPNRFVPELCCLKELGELGEQVARQFTAHASLIRHKYDARILGRLRRLFVSRKTDAVITVGAGDKMFWGRLAAWQSRIPVIASALHSTGWPDGIGRLNRWLTPITDAFIAVAKSHGEFLCEVEDFPRSKIEVIPNGVDVHRFRRDSTSRRRIRAELGLPEDAPVCGIVAALRPEKNHELFVDVAKRVCQRIPNATFLIIGDGPRRTPLMRIAGSCCGSSIRFLGTRSDVAEILSALDVFALTSHIEANPVSILEAMAAGLPVVATNVGSVSESILHGMSGFLVPPGDPELFSNHVFQLLSDGKRRDELGESARRRVVEYASLETMVSGYERLIARIYTSKFPLADMKSAPDWDPLTSSDPVLT